MQKYLFYSGSKYGLVDPYHRNIWIVSDRQDLLEQLSKIFFSKVSTAVYDLSSCSNYSNNLLDNSVCMLWDLPIADETDVTVSASITASQAIRKSRTNLVNSHSFGSKFLSADRKYELQSQFMLAHKILDLVEQYSITGSQLDSILSVLSSEIHLATIEDRIQEIAGYHLSSGNRFWILLLTLIGRLYG